MPRGREPVSGRDVLLSGLRESEFQAQVVTWAKRAGWLVHHVYDSRRSTGEGFPDLVLAKPGQPLLLPELKTLHGRERPEQHVWINTLNLCGAPQSMVWRPNHEEMIKAILFSADHRPTGGARA